MTESLSDKLRSLNIYADSQSWVTIFSVASSIDLLERDIGMLRSFYQDNMARINELEAALRLSVSILEKMASKDEGLIFNRRFIYAEQLRTEARNFLSIGKKALEGEKIDDGTSRET